MTTRKTYDYTNYDLYTNRPNTTVQQQQQQLPLSLPLQCDVSLISPYYHHQMQRQQQQYDTYHENIDHQQRASIYDINTCSTNNNEYRAQNAPPSHHPYHYPSVSTYQHHQNHHQHHQNNHQQHQQQYYDQSDNQFPLKDTVVIENRTLETNNRHQIDHNDTTSYYKIDYDNYRQQQQQQQQRSYGEEVNMDTQQQQHQLINRSSKHQQLHQHQGIVPIDNSSSTSPISNRNLVDGGNVSKYSDDDNDSKLMDRIFNLCVQDEWVCILDMLHDNPQLALNSIVMGNNITTTILHQAITKRKCKHDRIAVIVYIIQTTPSATTIKNGYGSLPIHAIVQRNIAIDSSSRDNIIRQLINAYPESITQPGGVGLRTPLHILFTDYYSPALTQELIAVAPQACYMKDKKGYLPAHVACSRHCSPAKLRMLLTVNPNALFDTTNDNHTLLSLAQSTATPAHPNHTLIDEIRQQLQHHHHVQDNYHNDNDGDLPALSSPKIFEPICVDTANSDDVVANYCDRDYVGQNNEHDQCYYLDYSFEPYKLDNQDPEQSVILPSHDDDRTKSYASSRKRKTRSTIGTRRSSKRRHHRSPCRYQSQSTSTYQSFNDNNSKNNSDSNTNDSNPEVDLLLNFSRGFTGSAATSNCGSEGTLMKLNDDDVMVNEISSSDTSDYQQQQEQEHEQEQYYAQYGRTSPSNVTEI